HQIDDVHFVRQAQLFEGNRGLPAVRRRCRVEVDHDALPPARDLNHDHHRITSGGARLTAPGASELLHMPAARKAPMPKWRPAPADLVQRFETAIRSVPDAQPRKMFGYPAAFINGQMFTGLFQDSMVLRLSAEDRAVLLQRPGAKAFEPMPGRVMKEYVVVPPAVISATASLEEWLAKAAGYGRSLPPKTPKSAGKRTKP